MKKSYRWALKLLPSVFVLTASCAQMPKQEATVHDFRLPIDIVDFSDGTSKRAILNLTTGIGSGAFRYRTDPVAVFYTVGDRGPNIDCEEDREIIGADLCEEGRIFPVPSYTPSIYKFQPAADMSGGWALVDTVRLKDRSGTAVTGLPNPLRAADSEAAYSRAGGVLALDPHGLDTEALIKLSDGSYWLADEYGPSLVHAKATGEIIERLVPAGIERDLQNVNYLVRGILPDILVKRKLNRGMEALAVSPREEFLYFIMESPLANPDSDAHKHSRNVRLFKMELGGAKIVAEYLYRLDIPETFAGADSGDKQSDVKISEMVAYDTDRLIVVEGIAGTKRLYKINLAAKGQSNIADSAWDRDVTSPSLEQLDDPASEGIAPLQKDLALDSGVDYPGILPKKIEGLAILDAGTLLLVNDNDFGIDGATTRFVELQVGPDFFK
ncbi:MAG: esterase-like activity of phytase family protein [Chromatiales bacterium]